MGTTVPVLFIDNFLTRMTDKSRDKYVKSPQRGRRLGLYGNCHLRSSGGF